MAATKTAGAKPSAPEKSQNPILGILRERFDQNMSRHKGLSWEKVEARLLSKPSKFESLEQMEATGGEPDVVGHDKKTGEFIFFDCSAESPKGRRSICYDHEARVGRKEHPPKSSAMEMAEGIGIKILSEAEYRQLQELGEFDLKTSSWVETPDEIRELGGAVFCDRRYDHVFLYHNGADSYYAARGFRGSLRV